ncbi:MAG TPA: SRPBCC domain-containing protein [Glaciihabitans sp.]|jgi:hypothetical protein|nr:SRPBCC domain-containing protein [Glaciihabitans sp.]
MNLRWPNGRVVRDADGLELIVERSVEAPAAEVWEWLTDPDKLEQWIGRWSGHPRVGSQLSFTMTAEAGAEPEPLTILICDRPQHFLADLGVDKWRIGFSLFEFGSATSVFFTQRLMNPADAGSIGPGWEFYLDRLVAAREGTPGPLWDDYYPAFSAYYRRVASSPS